MRSLECLLFEIVFLLDSGTIWLDCIKNINLRIKLIFEMEKVNYGRSKSLQIVIDLTECFHIKKVMEEDQVKPR